VFVTPPALIEGSFFRGSPSSIFDFSRSLHQQLSCRRSRDVLEQKTSDGLAGASESVPAFFFVRHVNARRFRLLARLLACLLLDSKIVTAPRAEQGRGFFARKSPILLLRRYFFFRRSSGEKYSYRTRALVGRRNLRNVMSRQT